ncbi:hypothetical protein [Nocardioides deserti]|uniref:YtkA-like domain-containing protein n=1 Tax=Nocardioides deserti TaxID=1588644 RepID=A0ABR6UCW3_9ACTN|nr:hypothetical protein [Nocardioides deserti]MBC2962286.1 hypothetical protein [Nocardioides deserti]GGO79064.1 hypothetical protein GCM10012276_37940 [Nocardioides deserti]
MKKLIIGLLASVLMAAGLVGATGTAANAEQCDRYGVCVEPNADVKPKAGTNKKNVKPNQRPKFKMKLKAAGNATVTGDLKVVIRPKKVGNGGTAGAVYKARKDLNGNGAATIKGAKLKPGVYIVTLKFIPNPNTPWRRVNRQYTLRVR